jgi:excisionase family DNA binding protein
MPPTQDSLNPHLTASDSKRAATGRLLDVAATADYLGTTERHIRRLVAERRIEYIKLGNGRSARLRFRIERLDSWLDEHTTNAEPDA